MLEKILYPTDFSDVSKKALAFIMGMAKAGVKEVVVLRVIDQRRTEYIHGISWAGKDEIQFFDSVNKQLEQEAMEELKPIKSKLKAAGLAVKLRIEKGVPRLKILEVEKEEDVSAIVLGSHGRSNLAEMLLGSVSEHVIRYCKKPVIVIKR
ncbi:MAG: universal stress protein [Deltaproteobacteria bacterium]|nr:universal stress protein [Deltaproteobacteria bacterium]